MKTRKPAVLVMLACLGLAGAAVFANAQTQAPPGPPQTSDSGPRGSGGPGEWSPRMDRWMDGQMGPRHHGRQMSREDRAAFFDARVAAIHAGLRLTPEQEKMWPSVESAVRDMAKSMTDLRDKSDAAGKPADPIQGMQRMAQAQIARGESLKKVADAAAPLYAALTPEQKARLPQLSHPGMRERMGMWMRHHGMRWGWGHVPDEGKPGWRHGSYDGEGSGFGPRGDRL